MTASPLPAGTDVGDSPNSKFQSRTGLFDTAGTDALGLVATSPAATSLLGRLKAIADAIGQTNGYVDGLEGFLDQVEGLITATNTAIGATNTALATLNGYNDTVEALLGTNNTLTGLTTPADDIFAVAKSDTVDLPTIPKALLCTVAGDVALKGSSGTTVVVPMIVGQVLPLRARRIMQTGTTATVFGLV